MNTSIGPDQVNFHESTIHQIDSRKPECYMGKSTWVVMLVGVWCMAALHSHAVRIRKSYMVSSGNELRWFLLAADVGSAVQLLCVIRSVVPKFVVCTLEYTNERRVVFIRGYFTGFLVIMTVPIVYFFIIQLGLNWSELLKGRWTARNAYTFAVVVLQICFYFFINCLYTYSVFKLIVYVPKHKNRYHWLSHERLWSENVSIVLVAVSVVLQTIPYLFKLESQPFHSDAMPRHVMTTWQLIGMNTTYYTVFINLFYYEKLVKSSYIVYDTGNIVTCVSVLLTFGISNLPKILTFHSIRCSTRNNAVESCASTKP